MNEAVLAILRCPISGQTLTFHDGDAPYVQSSDGRYRYPVEHGIAMLVADAAQQDAPPAALPQPNA